MNKKLYDSENEVAVCYDPELREWRQLISGNIKDGILSDLSFGKGILSINKKKKYIIPGFIDAHCHLLENPYPYSSLDEERSLPSIALMNALVAAQKGITSLKDMGGYEYKAIEIIKMLANFKVPRLFSSGCYFTTPGGHCSDRGAIEISHMEEFIDSLQKLIENDILFCKIINSDNGFELELLTKMIDYAHSLGMMVSCHAYTEKAARIAVEAGTDTLEHAGNYSDDLVDLIKERDVIVVPTYVAAVDSTPENCEGISDVDANVIREWIDGEKAVIPKLFKKKIKIALGTDSGFLGTPCDSLLREIELLHTSFSIEIADLLYSAYMITPLTVNMGGKLGKIENGFLADFLCYDKNPLDDVNVLIAPKEVWINGKRIDNALQNRIAIRRLTCNDIGSLSMLMRQYFFDCAELDDFWSDDEIVAWINDSNDYCTGAFIEGRIVGFCLTHHHKTANKVHIENIFVNDAFRGNGIAQHLVFDAVSYYRSKCSKVRFVGIVDITNESSIKLLLRNNFTKGHPMYWMQYNSYEQL